MLKVCQIKEKVLNNMESLNTGLWDLLNQAVQKREINKISKLESLIKKNGNIRKEISLFFDEMENEILITSESVKEPQGVRVYVKYGEPKSIDIFGKEIKIRKLNEIPISIGNWILEQGNNLVEVHNFLSKDKEAFKNMKSAYVKELKNGWYIEVGDDKKTLIRKAEKLLRVAGIAEHITIIED